MNLRRVTVAAFCVAAAASGTVAGCSADARDRSAVAAATCSPPDDEEGDFVETGTGTTAEEDIVVTSLGQGSYRVTGRAVAHDPDKHVHSVDFVCEVAPDCTDKLRGFKVTRLSVT